MNEEARVNQWRYEQFLAMGFEDWAAEALSREWDLDIAEFRKLIARGCPPMIALQILDT